jgi:hypothetical protein
VIRKTNTTTEAMTLTIINPDVINGETVEKFATRFVYP